MTTDEEILAIALPELVRQSEEKDRLMAKARHDLDMLDRGWTPARRRRLGKLIRKGKREARLERQRKAA